jgi:hypothetical protein
MPIFSEGGAAMRTCHCVIALAALAGAFLALPARAADGRPGKGLTEIPDSELYVMRGRYTVGDNAVAWFGVSMISTWQTASGQTLESTLALGMDFSRGDQPQVSFTPTVSITAANAPLPAVTDGVGRSVDGAGLGNVAGMAQSVRTEIDTFMKANLKRDGDAARWYYPLLMKGEWPVLLKILGKGEGDERYLSVAEVRTLFVDKRLPERITARLPKPAGKT